MGMHKIILITAGALVIISTVLYLLLEMWIIPSYVEADKQDMASNYTGYAYAAVATLLTAETIINTMLLNTNDI